MRTAKVLFKNSDIFHQAIKNLLTKRFSDVYIYYPGLLKRVNLGKRKDLPKYGEVDFSDFLLYNNLINFHLIGFPLCVFPKEKVTNFVNFLDPYPGVYMEKCNNCKEKDNCYGVPNNYLETFGIDEFSPFLENDYLLVKDCREDPDRFKRIWKVDKERQKKFWENYFKNTKGKILDAGAGNGAFLSFSPKRIIGIEKEMEKIKKKYL